jgi:hypothetical protein
MKKTFDITLNTQSTQSQSFKCPLVQLIEKRYGVKFEQQILICENSEINMPYQTHDELFREVGVVNHKDIDFNSLDELYEKTNSGYYSKFQTISLNRKKRFANN